jgi:hypothetical protein
LEFDIQPVQRQASLRGFSLADANRIQHVCFSRSPVEHPLAGVVREDDRFHVEATKGYCNPDSPERQLRKDSVWR